MEIHGQTFSKHLQGLAETPHLKQWRNGASCYFHTKSCQWKIICAQSLVKYGNGFTFSSIHWEQIVPTGKCTDQEEDATLPAPHP